MTKTSKCEQCDKTYQKASWNSRFCSKECRKDNLSKKSKQQTLYRQKHGELWKTIKPAKNLVVKVPPTRPQKRKFKISLILPDPQFGYRWIGNKLDPFHDEDALKLARMIGEYLRPDETVFLGDVLDLAPYGRYAQEPGFVETVQPALDRTFEELKVYDALSKKVVFIQGNHDIRLRRWVEDNARAAASIHVASAVGEDQVPVFSIQNLLRFKEMNIEHIDSYPIGYYWITKDLACIHGHTVKAAGMTAPFLASKENYSTIFGHIHRIETSYATKHSHDGPIEVFAHSPGTLARVDNAVPGVTSSLDTKGNPVVMYQNWQQGVSVVYSDDKEHYLEHIPFKNGTARFQGEYISIK